MSAVTVRVLDQHFAVVRRLAGQPVPATVRLAIATDAYFDQVAKAPRLVVAGHLARLTATTLAGPRISAEFIYRAGQLGYWIRPYDPLADARRWRWRPAQPCGRHVSADLAAAMARGIRETSPTHRAEET
jgi:hypothetical protein